MALPRTVYDRTRHAAARTSEFLFNQLIPYIGNKRKLLRLIHQAVQQTAVAARRLFRRFLRRQRRRGTLGQAPRLSGDRQRLGAVRQVVNRCYIACNRPPAMAPLGGYGRAIERLNRLPPVTGWVTEHLCPRDDVAFRRAAGPHVLHAQERHAHRRHSRADRRLETGGSRYRPGRGLPAGAAALPGLLHQQHQRRVQGFSQRLGRPDLDGPLSDRRRFAAEHARVLGQRPWRTWCSARMRKCWPSGFRPPGPIDIAYLDPPYNQHPYGSNYHVLNSVALWDKPALSKQITRGSKAAIRTRLADRTPQRVQLSATRPAGPTIACWTLSVPATSSRVIAPTA